MLPSAPCVALRALVFPHLLVICFSATRHFRNLMIMGLLRCSYLAFVYLSLAAVLPPTVSESSAQRSPLGSAALCAVVTSIPGTIILKCDLAQPPFSRHLSMTVGRDSFFLFHCLRCGISWPCDAEIDLEHPSCACLFVTLNFCGSLITVTYRFRNTASKWG